MIDAPPPPPGIMPSTADIVINQGSLNLPNRFILYGGSGVGKTTLAASLPGAVIMPAEEGFSSLVDRGLLPADLPSLPRPRKWSEVLAQVRWLRDSDHGYTCLVIDTVTSLEHLLISQVAKTDFDNKFQKFHAYGGITGANTAMESWRPFLQSLDDLRELKGMTIFLLGHAELQREKNAVGDDWDHINVSTVCKTVRSSTIQWVDAVLHVGIETVIVKSGLRSTGISSGKRVMRSELSASVEAKSRLDLPPVLDLGDDPAEASKTFLKALANARKRKASK